MILAHNHASKGSWHGSVAQTGSRPEWKEELHQQQRKGTCLTAWWNRSHIVHIAIRPHWWTRVTGCMKGLKGPKGSSTVALLLNSYKITLAKKHKEQRGLIGGFNCKQLSMEWCRVRFEGATCYHVFIQYVLQEPVFMWCCTHRRRRNPAHWYVPHINKMEVKLEAVFMHTGKSWKHVVIMCVA